MLSILKTAATNWSLHKSGRLGAALSYYSVFSLGPLLLIVIAIAGIMFSEEAVRGSLNGQFREILGPDGSEAIDGMLRGAASRETGGATALWGIGLLLVAALGVVVALKDALNTIWDVEPAQEGGIWWYVKTYLISLAGVLALGFLLIVSLVVSTMLAAVTAWAGAKFGNTALLGQAASTLVSLLVLTSLFAMLFKWFPDTQVAWADALVGAVVAAALFEVGKLGIAWYIARQGLQSTYGAAASFVVLLIWVYYTAQIMLFGAEVSRACALHREELATGSPG
jgi:membrane protein